MPINFPGSLDTNKTLFNPFNRYKWTSFLKSAITASATDVILTDVVDIPAQVEGNYIGIDDEIMFVSSVDNRDPSNRKLVVIRAQGDSDATTHDSGVEVAQCHTAELHNKLVEAILALQTYVLNAAPTATTVSLTASPHTYSFTGFIGYNYILKIAVKTSDGLTKQVKSYLINQWNDAVNVPQAVEEMLFEVGLGIDIQITDLQANTAAFNIVVTGANGGEMKITVHEKGAIE